MIDLHTHILPGVDDGAQTLEEAVEMCRVAAADGCEVLVATPHQRHHFWSNTDAVKLRRPLEALQRELGDSPRVVAGAEIYVDSEFLADLDRYPESGLLPLAESHYLLLEFDRSVPPPEPATIVHEVAVAGFRPILAHPELIPWLGPDLRLIETLLEQGALFQITAMSVTGGFGPGAKRVARELVERRLVHFLASDCHGVATRRPGLSAAAQVLRETWGEEIASQLTRGNPGAVLEDRPLEAAA